jgi:broad specificity polyphosphatase/5'/3'-nucleotidase SurE
VLLTYAGGIRSAGLAALVDALVAADRCDVHVCAPESYVLRLRKPNHSGTSARIGSDDDASKEWRAADGAQIGSCTCSAAA